MKAKEFQKMNTQELLDQLKELKTELFNLRFQMATGQLQNPMVIGQCKKNIARVKTILRERELSAAAK
ncbi:MAG: 50S ribosomal protein L29 [Christensenellales bacterium]|jgi:large subunit ribosomal protein L29